MYISSRISENYVVDQEMISAEIMGREEGGGIGEELFDLKSGE